jgi:hypothetical protein
MTPKKAAYTQLLTAGASYTRRAGLISVDAGFSMNAGAFAGLPGQNYTDPGFTLGFTKGSGRTTGSLDFSAAKSNAPDPVANDRAIAWNYSAAQALRYQLIDRYFFTNTATVGGTSYQNQKLFANQVAYSDAFQANVIYDSKLSFDTGYHVALDQTHDTNNWAHNFTFGAVGNIIPNVTGSIEAGYAYDQSKTRHQKENDYQSFTGDANLIWHFSRVLSFSGNAAKSFGISSTDVVTNTTSAGIVASGNVGKRFRTDVGVNGNWTAFLSPNGLGRRDTLLELTADLGTAITTHLRVNLNYTYMENYSNISTGKFIRETITLTLLATY